MVAVMLNNDVMIVFRWSIESPPVETSVATIATPTSVTIVRASRLWVRPDVPRGGRSMADTS